MQIEVKEAVMCRNCAEWPLAWLQSKAGKWYLAKAEIEGQSFLADKTAFHRCKKLSHTDRYAASQRYQAWLKDRERDKERKLNELKQG